MKTYAYLRVSTLEQHIDRQLIIMQELGIPNENIFIDKLSGKDTKRPELQKLLSILKSGDRVIVESISRFARNTKDLLNLVEQLTSISVEFISQKEHLDTSTATGKFMLTIFGAVAELEREYILQRQAEGIASAKRRGVKFGRPIKKPPENFAELIREWEKKNITTEQILKKTNLKIATFYRRLSEYKATKKKK